MRTSHLYLFAVAAATVGFVAIAPAAASDAHGKGHILASMQDAESEGLSPEQQAEFDSWPAEKQAAFELWPGEVKAYYWTLSNDRQMIFWALADSDKLALTAMEEPERENAWTQIESRVGATEGA